MGCWSSRRRGAIRFRPCCASSTPEPVASGVRADETLWLFAGRSLQPDISEDAEVLADMSELANNITQTFGRWLPVWDAIMLGSD